MLKLLAKIFILVNVLTLGESLSAGYPQPRSTIEHNNARSPANLPSPNSPMEATKNTLDSQELKYYADGDRDGVITPVDKCWFSKAHKGVDQQGCQPFYFYSLGKVYFEFDRAKLTEEGLQTLNQAIFILLGNTDSRRLIIQGFTDYIGSHKYNYRLADRRVTAAVDYLLNNGVPKALLKTRSLGETDPIDENWRREGRGRNRHVDIILIELE